MPGIPGAMTVDHKEALAVGRAEGRHVRRYLEALEKSKPHRGRRPSIESLQRQLDEINEKIGSADSLQRLQFIQRRKTIEDRLNEDESQNILLVLEKEFVAVAAAYGERKSIDYATWREIGVPVAVLAAAGITR